MNIDGNNSPKDKSPAEAFRIKHFGKIITVIILSGVAPSFLYSTEHNAEPLFSLKYLLLPILILIIAIIRFFMSEWYSKLTLTQVRFLKFLIVPGYSLLITIILSQYLVVINATFGPQEQFNLKGTIVELKKDKKTSNKGNLGPYYFITIEDMINKKQTTFKVKENEFFTYHIGDFYNRVWYRGSLNFIYKKKY